MKTVLRILGLTLAASLLQSAGASHLLGQDQGQPITYQDIPWGITPAGFAVRLSGHVSAGPPHQFQNFDVYEYTDSLGQTVSAYFRRDRLIEVGITPTSRTGPAAEVRDELVAEFSDLLGEAPQFKRDSTAETHFWRRPGGTALSVVFFFEEPTDVYISYISLEELRPSGPRGPNRLGVEHGKNEGIPPISPAAADCCPLTRPAAVAEDATRE